MERKTSEDIIGVCVIVMCMLVYSHIANYAPTVKAHCYWQSVALHDNGMTRQYFRSPGGKN